MVKFAMLRASELLRGDSAEDPLTTGYGRFDEFMGGLEGGQLYLLYGSPHFLDELLHRLMVRASRDGQVAYMNNTDYYSEKTLLRPDRLAFHAKREGMDPSRVFDRIYFVAAYNELRQPKAATALAERMREEGGSTRLLVAHRVSRFLEGAKDRNEAMESLNRSLSSLWHLCAREKVVMVVTTDPVARSRVRFPGPAGTNLMKHMANVMVFFRGSEDSVQAVLLKHPGRATPESVSILPEDDPLMGRITPNFRQTYQELLDKLRKNYVAMLRDPRHKAAFESLLMEAWDSEHAAMSNSESPLVLDALNLTANVHNKSEIDELKERLARLEKRVGADEG
ncbi:MAG: hypothetical protein ACRD6W_17610 [Nitrososphaerales archaeon]